MRDFSELTLATFVAIAVLFLLFTIWSVVTRRYTLSVCVAWVGAIVVRLYSGVLLINYEDRYRGPAEQAWTLGTMTVKEQIVLVTGDVTAIVLFVGGCGVVLLRLLKRPSPKVVQRPSPKVVQGQ